MGAVELLERYRRYLETVDEESCRFANEEDYLDLMGEPEILDLLLTRDKLAESRLTQKQAARLARLDDLLVKHARLITANLLPLPGHPRFRWWWFLHEGPHVRDQALAAGREHPL